MSASLVYRSLIALRGCWLLVEWLFGWGSFSHFTIFTWTHPYANLAVALLTGPFRVQRYSLSPPPPFVAPVGALMLLLTKRCSQP
jgi:hypothetical protein